MRLGKCLYSYRISFSSLTRANVEKRKTFVRTVVRNAYQRRSLPTPPFLDSSQDTLAVSTVRVQDYDNNLAAQFIESVIDQKRESHFIYAVRTGLQCASLNPLVLHYQKALIYSVLPMKCIGWIRSSKNR